MHEFTLSSPKVFKIINFKHNLSFKKLNFQKILHLINSAKRSASSSPTKTEVKQVIIHSISTKISTVAVVIPQIGNTPKVNPRAVENANCLGSAPLHKKSKQKILSRKINEEKNYRFE